MVRPHGNPVQDADLMLCVGQPTTSYYFSDLTHLVGGSRSSLYVKMFQNSNLLRIVLEDDIMSLSNVKRIEENCILSDIAQAVLSLPAA